MTTRDSIRRFAAMSDVAAQARAERIATAPRLGTASGSSAIAQLFAAGKPVVVQANFFRCGCSSDYYLLHDRACFDDIASRFRGDNPELHLYRADVVIDKTRAASRRLDRRCGNLRAELARLVSQWVVLLRCSRMGEAERYLLVETDEQVEQFTARDWKDWDVRAYDLVAALDQVEGTIVMPNYA